MNTTTVLDAFAASLNDYGLPPADASRVADTLLAIVAADPEMPVARLRALLAEHNTPTPDPHPNRAVDDATYRRHSGEWRLCGDPRPHSEHQMSYSPWRACPGVRAVPVQEPTS